MSDEGQALPQFGQSLADDTPAEGRGRSTIEFPYYNLKDAIELAEAVHGIGGTSCTWSQLAAKLNQAAGGGSFRLRVSAARMFGFLEYKGQDVSLTELGRRVIDPGRSRGAKIDAFVRVPLYARLFNELEDNLLPPVAAINRMVAQFGVAPKQVDKARQGFMSSARHAGYFDLSPNKLVKPNAASPGANGAAEALAADEQLKSGGGEPPERPGLHPFIEGLLKTLPHTDAEWPMARRVKWLQAAGHIFDLIYSKSPDDDSSIEIKVSGEEDRR